MTPASDSALAGNTLAFVRCQVALLRAAGLDVWLAGGWAEEVRGLGHALGRRRTSPSYRQPADESAND